MREIINFNTNWEFFPKWSDDLKSKYLDSGYSITLPHTVKEIDLHYTDETETFMVCGYQNDFIYDSKALKDKRVLIHFEGAMAAAEVFVNGNSFGEHKGGYLPFTYDITDFLRDGDNLIAVKLDSTERKDIPPFGNEIDYLCYGGIYREVQIIIVDDVSIENVMLTALANYTIVGKVRIRNSRREKIDETLVFNLYTDNKFITEISKEVIINDDLFTDIDIYLEIDPDKIELWDLDNPKLYTLDTSISNEDLVSIRVGFRNVTINENGFFLNDKRIKLRGLNRHQSYPYVGYAMPERVQKKDADILKYDLGLNVVRSSHYPASRHFLDRCDEIGLLVFEEIPGWQYIGDKDWQKVAIDNVVDMIERDFHHPSIYIWGVRINESQDNHSFYKETNSVAHRLDKTRPTGGVRYIKGSELLEDVYTYNDFKHTGNNDPIDSQRFVTKLDKNVPYMITEYNGHMFPTKMQDCEERLLEHTERHYRIINAIALDNSIIGGTGWCAFDYNTHFDFGSGDRVCYHGVCDMFRNKKFAASAYSSQKDIHKNQYVLEPVTIHTRGERSGGGIFPLIISTNCDYIELYFDDELAAKEYPATAKYAGLKHPPIIVNLENNVPGVSNIRWKDMRIVGFVRGKAVIERKYLKNPTFHSLLLRADNEVLNAINDGSTWDSTRITVKAVDSLGNKLPFINEAINIDVKGVGELIGNDNPVLEGGVYSFWVRTTHRRGSIKISVSNRRVETGVIEIKVK